MHFGKLILKLLKYIIHSLNTAFVIGLSVLYNESYFYIQLVIFILTSSCIGLNSYLILKYECQFHSISYIIFNIVLSTILYMVIQYICCINYKYPFIGCLALICIELIIIAVKFYKSRQINSILYIVDNFNQI